jgi:hypothetical protein
MSVSQPEEQWSRFEEELSDAMRRVDPPEGFAERVMARAQANDKPRARIVPFPRRARVWVSGAIAAALLAGVFVAEQMRLRQERERTELARQQFEAAMRITGETLQQARQQLQQAGVRVGTDGN